MYFSLCASIEKLKSKCKTTPAKPPSFTGHYHSPAR